MRLRWKNWRPSIAVSERIKLIDFVDRHGISLCMTRLIPLLLLAGVLVTGCTQQVDGATSASVSSSQLQVSASLNQSAPGASESAAFRLPGSITLSPVMNEVLGKFGGNLDWTECRGVSSLHDLTYRALVTVTDDDDEIVGQHILGTGLLDEATRTCRMQFAVQVKEGSSAWYWIRIGDREPVQVSSSIARTVGAHMTIG